MTVNTYTIIEAQSLAASRGGTAFVGTLLTAKRTASRNRVFSGTVLRIELDGVLLAYKEGEYWVNTLQGDIQ